MITLSKSHSEYYTAGALALLYLVGLIGLWSPLRVYVAPFTPYNLLLTFALLLYYHQHYTRGFVVCVGLVLVGGYGIELTGVATGDIFGDYYYGKTLGLTLIGIPVIIGVNWFILTYCTAVALDRMKAGRYIKILLGSFLLVGIDWLIEPVAMHLDFWQWSGGEVPMQNYIGWFFISLVFLTLIFHTRTELRNPMAIFVLVLQIVFFAISNFMIALT
jgi:putative membrane protein